MTRPVIALIVVTMGILIAAVALFMVRLGDEDSILLTTFVDDEVGVQIGYPEGWEVLESDDPQVRLIATPNGLDSVLLRAVDLTVAIDDPVQLERAREFTTQLVTEGTGVEIVAGPNAVELDGLSGWFYLYRFKDNTTGLTGVHSHYFLFRDKRMIVMVFQGLPEANFTELAPTFDQIAESFRSQDS